MIHLIRSDSAHPDFLELVKLLDAELAVRDGDDHSFYHQFNKLEGINHVLLAYENEIVIGCGALKQFDDATMEVKRMFTVQEHRGKSIAGRILSQLEEWATELGFKKLVLETGFNQPEAIRLYKKSGYHIIDNYGQYANVDNSMCFGKELV
jgi:GNAT superfamily N-acetyltransferase